MKSIACGSKYVLALGSDKPSFEFNHSSTFYHYRNQVYSGNQSINQDLSHSQQ